ncbi:hypothetical protein CNY89_25870, partial [Amaricoccus sp. HAR-UPW-R2A-40]
MDPGAAASSVGAVDLAAERAVVKETGMRQNRFWPSRSKIGCGATSTKMSEIPRRSAAAARPRPRRRGGSWTCRSWTPRDLGPGCGRLERRRRRSRRRASG